jgi:unsaturated chondroitin disaccharide hydrolase
MIKINYQLTPQDFESKLTNFWKLSGEKILNIAAQYNEADGAPVFTKNGKYTSRGWTEWTQGFQYGSAILQFDATNDFAFLELGRSKTLEKMGPHVSHIGVHDHGFNNVSTYGNLLRLMQEGKLENNPWERNFYELALKISGAVQASRWTTLKNQAGFIHSFNGAHSLFVDTIRSCRALVLSHTLGHVFYGENDEPINMLERAIKHIEATAIFSVYYGEERDIYDSWGRTAHECLFNVKDGSFRCPNSQQGYTGFSTWTRGLAWAMCGFSEQLECLEILSGTELETFGGRTYLRNLMMKAAKATCDFYIENTPACGIPYWDTGAPHLHRLENYLQEKANPFNAFEPVDSSAAAIAAQGLLRLGNLLIKMGEKEAGSKYWQAGLTVLHTLFEEPYLSHDPDHQGLILHSIYHRPNGWDYVPAGSAIPYGESSMWGDYHAREAALYLQKIIQNQPYYTFFNCLPFN